jgi:predicted AlkP superfamily phosphohydrolase/phosphomutase
VAVATSPPKVLYVALDACDSALMVELADSGKCPTLAGLLRDGAVTETIAPTGTYVGSSWMTITTGSGVGSHRYWNWLEVDPATYRLQMTTPREARGRPFWEHLSDAGRRVAVLDVPHAAAPESFNGVVLKEWGCHDRHDGTASTPPDLLDELDRTVGRHPVGCRSHPAGDEAFAPCDYTLRADAYRTPDEERELLDLIRAGVDAKHRASVRVLEQEPWDLFATVLGESHCVGHQLWHVHDRSHPRHDPAVRELLGDPIEDIYVRLDAVLGDLVGRCGPETTVFVQMNHGMGPHFDGAHLLDQLLHRIDESMDGVFEPGSWSRVGRTVNAVAPAPLRGPMRRAIASAARFKARIGPPSTTHGLGPRPDRRFFQVPGNTSVGAVRFNVVGREAHGMVRPGEDYDRLCDAVSAALLEVIDIDSGRPLVRSVVRSERVLERHADDRVPDLFVEYERASLVERVWSPMTGTVAAPYDHWRTGDHHDGGIVIARGPGIAGGRRPGSMTLDTVAPTLAAALGVELPGADGAVRWDLVGRAGVTALRSETAGALDRLAARDREIDELRRRVEVAERERLIDTTMSWIAQEPVDDEVLITVITPTHARPERLAEAIRSVVAQRHRSWEMVVVDDGSETAAPVVAEIGDPRVRLVEVDHGGVCRARNIALDHARGDIITYLDDDNLLDPSWLHAVAWAFGNRVDASVLYGARVIDDFSRVHGNNAGGWPWVQFNRFDRAALEQDNFADMGVIAHRRGVDARFDEALIECGDWDFFLSLTEHEDPIELPSVAFYYRTDGTDRLTGLQPSDADVVRRRWQHRSGRCN